MVLLTMVLTKYALMESGVFIQNFFFNNLQFTYLSSSILFITAGGYIINDIFDLRTDKINKPNKVIIDRFITTKSALKAYYIITSLGLLLGFLMSYKWYHLGLFLVPTIVLFLYSKYFKKKMFLGNVIISLLIAYSIYLIYKYHFITQCCYEYSIFEEPLKNTIFVYIIFSFITTLIREIIKDIEDINGDLKIKAKTLPIVIGRKRASHVAFFFSSILLIFLLLVLQFIRSEYLFLGYGIIFLLLPLLYFMYKLWFAETKKDFSSLSNQMKIIMLFGILSMLLFKFI
ncbi:geranylgeranylglycerol-phosphate geranylgeranyltransferase [uncultured Polaribacter sp.]|uniref:geranylgeranylglycerol-phosphate geranylgeranyltransferase n=1 Tax=uncultured Polaribacter sp. TaxID=174711 RepID=UPI0026166904|nr:geranylgeranylglycerol-phosphate geranylgeranyltransferase [uncultured Polaribacter sp.]